MNRDLIKEVIEIIEEVNTTHRYSMSKIYGAYNKVFNKNEEPQSCASCLIRKVRELNKWLESELELLKEQEKSIGFRSTPVGNYEKVKSYKENTYLTDKMKNEILEAEKVTTKKKRKEAN